jgi:hypothetical protein
MGTLQEVRRGIQDLGLALVPGKGIRGRSLALSRFKGLHAGQSVAILGNGPSLIGHDLSLLKRTIGTNRTLRVHPSPTYQVCLEHVHADAAPVEYMKLAREGKLFVAGAWEMGHVIPLLNGGPVKFSRDLEEGVVTQIGTTGSVIYAAVQIAAFMGYAPIFLVGVDLAGPHFDGTPASRHLARQNELFAHVPSDVEVRVVGESKAWFPRVSFEEAIA